MNVGVMKDYKLRDLHASHTLGCIAFFHTWNGIFFCPPVLRVPGSARLRDCGAIAIAAHQRLSALSEYQRVIRKNIQQAPFSLGRRLCVLAPCLSFSQLSNQSSPAARRYGPRQKHMIGPGRVTVTVCDLNAVLAPGPQEQGLLI
jgi:hypothetical protein